MSVEENKAVVRQFMEAADRHSTEGVEPIMSPDVLEQFEGREVVLVVSHRIADTLCQDPVWRLGVQNHGYRVRFGP